MPDIRINTDAAVTAAGRIEQINKDINTEFESVSKAIKSLDASWDGTAATKTIDRFGSIKKQCCDSRFKVLKNYSTFLLNAVGQGYEETETSNISLADQFK